MGFVFYIIMRTLDIRLSDWWCSVKASEFLQNGFCILHHNEALDIRLSEWCCSVKASVFLQNGFCILHHNEALDIRLSVGTVVYQSDKTSGNFWDLPCKVTCEPNSLCFSA
jgi:hypothetical protein